MLLPVVPTFVANQFVKCADLNQIRDAINLLLYGRPIGVTKQTLNATTISASTWTDIPFDTVEWDSAGGFDDSGSKYTCQLAGRYQISGLIEFKLEASPTGDRSVRCQINGNTDVGLGSALAAANVITGVQFSKEVYLNLGDVLTFQALSTQATSTVINWNGQANEASFFDLFWIGA